MSLALFHALKARGLVGNIQFPSPEVQKSKQAAYDLTRIAGIWDYSVQCTCTLYIGAGPPKTRSHSAKRRRRKAVKSGKKGKKPKKAKKPRKSRKGPKKARKPKTKGKKRGKGRRKGSKAGFKPKKCQVSGFSSRNIFKVLKPIEKVNLRSLKWLRTTLEMN